jgi:pimeloyl-ACP methyl ester carboxylesterase
MWMSANGLDFNTLGPEHGERRLNEHAATPIAFEAWNAGCEQVAANGIELKVHVAGSGPAVVLCHGFPELGFSWRHQVGPLVEAGFRVLVPDMRGFGGSPGPEGPEGYDILTLVGDVTGLLDAFGLDDAVFIGHDWGAAVVWHAAIAAPERVRAVAGLSVPFVRRAPAPPIAILRRRLGADFYMVWFQEPGMADPVLARDVRRTLATRELWNPEWAASDSAAPPPSWLTDAEFDAYVGEYERTGFTGGLNYYRNLDENWRLTEELSGRRIEQPSLFLAGSRDPVLRFMPADGIDELLVDLRGKVLIDGAGHWIQQERPDLVNEALLEFLAGPSVG